MATQAKKRNFRNPGEPAVVLVTGGAGFIGSHLCEQLLARGDYVICLDNFFTGKHRNIQGLMSNPRFEVVRHDVTEPIRLEADFVFNMACPASPVHYQYDPIKTMKTSVLGMLNVLEMAEKCGARVLQASTSEVYGDPVEHPQREDYRGNVNPIGIRACYDEGKRASETLCFDFQRERGVEVRVIRIFNTYGPRMDVSDGRVVSNFIAQALRGEDITIYGDGSQTRSFCYVSDLVRGIMAMMDHPDFSGPVNLGNDGEFTVKELAERVIALTGAKSKLVNNPLPSDDPTRRRPDLTLAGQKLGYKPLVPLEEGLKKTIPWYREVVSSK
ncbi:MAG: SDR family oxidoreductase [Spirochaetia bacterium]|nr:SDR family oxidoreductase [Spirochaetia bacterium]